MPHSETLDPELEGLRDRWERSRKHWHIWRSVTYDRTLGDWCATRLSPDAGPELTVIADTASALESALVDQAKRAAGGERPMAISHLFGEP